MKFEHKIKNKFMGNRKKFIDTILFIVLVIFVCMVIIKRDELFLKPQYEFTTVSEVFEGQNDTNYVVDNGKEIINVVTMDHTLIKQIKGGSYDKFYYAQGVCEGDDGTLYISDESYNEEGIVENRVVEYKRGKYKSLFSVGEKTIYEIQYYDGSVYFLCREDYGLGLYKMIPGEEAKLIRQIYMGDVLNGASIDLESGVVAIAVRRGAVRILPKEATSWITIKKDMDHFMPQDVSAREGRVYFSEIYGSRVCCFEQSSPDDYETIYSKDGIKIMYINAYKNGKGVLCSDYSSYYNISYDETGKTDHYYEKSVTYKGFWKTVILWLLVLVSFVIICRLMRYVIAALLKVLHKESSLRMIVVLIAVVSVSGFISWSLLSEAYKNEDESDIAQMKIFTDFVVSKIDLNLLKNIEWETDYESSSYNNLRDSLNKMILNAYSEGKDYYYVFYGVKDGKLRYLMNYYDTVTCGEPYGNADVEYYMDVYNNGTTYAIKSRDADGTWLFIVCPVYDDTGKRIAILEIGTDLSYRIQERRTDTINILIKVFCSSAVVLMLIIESLFLLSFFERRNKDENAKNNPVQSIPLRTITLLSYATSTIQDSFITILSSKLYTGNLPLPEGVAIGLPLSVELLMMSAFALVGGRMTDKFGTKKTLFSGIFIEISGFLVCALSGNYMGLVIGNILVGIGMGIINVTCNIIAAMSEGLNSTADAFADIMAGILSGLTIGAGIASLLYPIGGSKMSYIVAACLMVPTIFLVKNSISIKPDDKKEAAGSIGFVKFFLNLRVLGFFVLILVPFMISISYREYFLPMYITENGMEEGRVGQIFLLSGLMVIYIGPYISNYVIKRFGTFWSVIIASIAMGLNMWMFVIKPSVVTAILGIFILSSITSFAYTCQYTFFEQLPDSFMYGDSKAMGVYSIFENFGQTVGPMAYGVVLGLGYRAGLSVIGLILIIFTLTYILLMKFFKQSGLFK